MSYQETHGIATPEGLYLELPLAGLGSRGAATAIDWGLRILLYLGVVWVSGGEWNSPTVGWAVFSVLVFLLFFGYEVAFEVLNGGRTPGKMRGGFSVLRADQLAKLETLLAEVLAEPEPKTDVDESAEENQPSHDPANQEVPS